jgi:DNA-binding NarL/FixJ family response regulator
MNADGAGRLISICDEENLRYSRELILRYAGYDTVSVSSNATLEELTSTSFDIAIVCQSISSDHTIRILETLRRSNPRLRVLRINTYPNRPWASFGMDYEVPGRPIALLRAVASLRGEVRRSA